MNCDSIGSIRALNPINSFRKAWHDYSSRAIYLITLYRHPSASPLSKLTGLESERESDSENDKVVSHFNINLHSNGEIVVYGIKKLVDNYRGILISDLKILPDYVTFLLYNRSENKPDISELINTLKETCNQEHFKATFNNREIIKSSSELFPLFDGGFDDRIARRRSDVDRFRKYLSDCFHQYQYLKNLSNFTSKTVITRFEGRKFVALGNLLLLSDPQISAVKISSKYGEEELRNKKVNWYRTILNGGVLVSPFISGAEYRVMKWALENGGRVIRILPNGFKDDNNFDEETMKPIEEGRLLLIAPDKYDPTVGRPSRRLCLLMNDIASEISTE